ncbi:hypothetical protein GC163_06520 [bacterium]|nr:hypothetical protein [bacterium]
MSESNPPADDDAFVWDSDVSRKPPERESGEGSDAETYKIPGGLSGWIPGEIAPPNSDGTVRKSPPRQEASPPVAPTARKPRKRQVSDAWVLMGCNVLVFLSSLCVMMLELTASRLIAKHVGSSLYTWTSVIGVVLAGITLGNYLGGWLADRFPRAKALAWMFLLSSIACASVLWLDQLVSGMPRPDNFSWPAWVLCVVGTMFLLPAMLLGTTSPLVASLALERSTRTGLTVGNVYAWGTFGSIIGTFLTGFYLVDVWGTRAIIGFTAALLALLAIAVAGSRYAFRTGVLFGWMQLLAGLWVISTITAPSSQAFAERCEAVLPSTVMGTQGGWSTYGHDVGQQLHKLGLLLKLRGDALDAYHDESSYSYIQVRDDLVNGHSVRALQLDHLDHSYFDPTEPTALHYEYEEIYAAITHRAAPQDDGELSIAVADFPGRDELVTQLPEGARYDAATHRLSLSAREPALLDALLNLSPSADYWRAVNQLYKETTEAYWGGFSTVTLDQLPEGVSIPTDLTKSIRYDSTLTALSAYEAVTPAERDTLLALSPQHPWYVAVESLRKQSSRLNTLFLGGGGFVFPRWILAEFPAAERVDVAELDPAVYAAVRQQMGLTDAENQRIRTLIGDARNTVDDLLRANQLRVEQNLPPERYDFIYGDAFNDLSVPWHLTTQEFTQKLADLLTDRGVFLANIIEIYPRTEVPGGTITETFVTLRGNAPEGLFAPPEKGELPQVASKFVPVFWTSAGQLGVTGVLPSVVETRLRALKADDDDWQSAISQLQRDSQQKLPLPMALPQGLRPDLLYSHTWLPCPDPFAGIEVYRWNDTNYALGFRGQLPETLREQLVNQVPSDRAWQLVIDAGAERSQSVKVGRFLGRYVHTMTTVFPHVTVFSTSSSQPSSDRDTYVVVCAKQPIDLTDLGTVYSTDSDSGEDDWQIAAFAEAVRKSEGAPLELRGQMSSLLELAEGQILTDDYAPVDNLLRGVFADQ